MFSEAIVCDNKPKEVELIAGEEYFYCTCGKSKNEPFCDGSHKGSSCKPQVFKVEESKKYHMCSCKSSSKAPFCDGRHSIYNQQDIGKKVKN